MIQGIQWTTALSASGTSICLSLLACSPEPRSVHVSGGVDTLQDGTIQVTNVTPEAGGVPVSLWSLSRIATFGNDSVQFGEIGEATADVRNRIWVADIMNDEIHVFGSDGSYVMTVGRSGQGPGEFGRIGPLFWGPEDRLWVEDLSLLRWEVFDLDGRRIAGMPIRSNLPGGMRAFARDGALLVLTSDESGTVGILRQSVTTVDTDPTDSFLPLPPPPEAPFLSFVRSDGRGSIEVPLPFSPQPSASLSQAGGVWLAGANGEYRIQWKPIGEGRGIEIVTRSVRPEIPNDVRDAAVEKLRSEFAGSRLEGDLNWEDVPTIYPPFHRIHESPDGQLWVERQMPDGRIGFDVYERGGLLSAQVLAGFTEAARVAEVGRSFVLTVDRDEMGVETVGVHQIRR